jgi:hypothetical protein
MKQIVEVSDEGLESLMGKTVTLFCLNYFYTGILVGVNDDCVKLKDPSIVYETGSFDSKDWSDAQRLPRDYWYVRVAVIESFGEMK